MSRIIEKIFNAKNKIIRSIFKGSPNLITSSDLNRQFEAIKYQLDQLDEKTGFYTDLQVTHSLSSGTLSIEFTYSYMEFKGCSFSPAIIGLNTNLTPSAPTAYLCLVADSEVVTYETDNSHEIAGAKFEDGTSLPAANQMVYKNESIILTHSLSGIGNLVGILASITLTDVGNVIIKINSVRNKSSLSMEKDNIIRDFNPNLSGVVKNGISYDSAFSILANRFRQGLSIGWTDLNEKGSSFMIKNGILYLNLLEESLNVVATRLDVYVISYATFPETITTKLVELFNSVKYNPMGKFTAGGAMTVYPIANFPVFQEHTMKEVEDTETRLELVPPSYGQATMALMANFSDNNVITNVFIGVYINHLIKFNKEFTHTFEKGPISWLSLQNPLANIYVPRICTQIPLIG